MTRSGMWKLGAAVVAAAVTIGVVWVISTPPWRVAESRLVQVYNHALAHAGIAWNAVDADGLEAGQRSVPRDIVADLSDLQRARRSEDPMIAEAARKFPGYSYVIRFEESDLEVAGSSAVASIEIKGPDGATLTTRQFLARDGAPTARRFRSPAIGKRR